MQTAVKNRIHALMDLNPDALPEKPGVSDLFGKLGMDWLGAVELPRPDRKRLSQLLEVYEFLHRQIQRTDAEVRKIVKSDLRCPWSATMPGIGDFFAALIMAEVDDIKRFSDSKQFVCCTGLVPGRDCSDEVIHYRRMHKQGSKWIRWAPVEAAIAATTSNRALYDRVCQRKGPLEGPKVAKVAAARKLAEVAVPRRLFATILRRINRLCPVPV
jgi:transposase